MKTYALTVIDKDGNETAIEQKNVLSAIANLMDLVDSMENQYEPTAFAESLFSVTLTVK